MVLLFVQLVEGLTESESSNTLRFLLCDLVIGFFPRSCNNR